MELVAFSGWWVAGFLFTLHVGEKFTRDPVQGWEIVLLFFFWPVILMELFMRIMMRGG